MKRSWTFILLLLSGLAFFTACEPDDFPDIDPDKKPSPSGTWVSAETDIAPILQDSLTNIRLVLASDSSYVLSQTDFKGSEHTFSGIYSIGNNDNVSTYEITFLQNSPSTATYTGIFELNRMINPAEIVIEMVQTAPTNTYAIPTLNGGFGSTEYGDLGVDNIQKFREDNTGG